MSDMTEHAGRINNEYRDHHCGGFYCCRTSVPDSSDPEDVQVPCECECAECSNAKAFGARELLDIEENRSRHLLGIEIKIDSEEKRRDVLQRLQAALNDGTLLEVLRSAGLDVSAVKVVS